MAKRIKVKGKAPRGLSKAQRIKIAPLQRKLNKISSSERKRADPGGVSESTLDAIDCYQYMIDEIAERPDISSGASSERKKLVKEGNPRFIGPRQLEEFDPWKEFEIPEGSWTPRSQHEASRGFKKRDRREDDRRWAEGPMDRLPSSRSWRKPFTEKLSKRDVEELKKEILREAGSKEGRLLYKMLIRNPQLRERWARRKEDRKNQPPF